MSVEQQAALQSHCLLEWIAWFGGYASWQSTATPQGWRDPFGIWGFQGFALEGYLDLTLSGLGAYGTFAMTYRWLLRQDNKEAHHLR